MLTVPVQTTLMILAVLLGSLALLVVAGAIYQAIGTWRDHRRFPPSGRLVRVNKRQMHIHVTGEGAPTVVFESGMGASCLSWTLVQPQVAQFTRAVSYDRAGHGWSDPARERRTAEQIAQELHTLLDAAAVPGPYVLVGHSFGGYVNRAFAHMYRDEVVGMVLVDSIHLPNGRIRPRSSCALAKWPCDTLGLRRGSHDWVLFGFASPGWLEVRPGWHGRR
jgi:pimeloyl-ACP methyl ester carboxylesterase